jgi:hypothetical protein
VLGQYKGHMVARSDAQIVPDAPWKDALSLTREP